MKWEDLRETLFNVSRLQTQNGQESESRVYFRVKKTRYFGCAEGQCAHARARSSQEQHQIREM